MPATCTSQFYSERCKPETSKGIGVKVYARIRTMKCRLRTAVAYQVKGNSARDQSHSMETSGNLDC